MVDVVRCFVERCYAIERFVSVVADDAALEAFAGNADVLADLQLGSGNVVFCHGDSLHDVHWRGNGAPSNIVPQIGMSPSDSASTAYGSSARTVKSASFPEVTLPRSFSSPSTKAASMVVARSA